MSKGFEGTAEMLRVSAQDRAKLRQGMLAQGVPPAIADEVLDLSLHAADQAFETLFAVLDRASSNKATFAGIGIAAPIVISGLQVVVDAAKSTSRAGGFEPRRIIVDQEGGAQ